MAIECDRDCWLFAKTCFLFFWGSHVPFTSSLVGICGTRRVFWPGQASWRDMWSPSGLACKIFPCATAFPSPPPTALAAQKGATPREVLEVAPGRWQSSFRYWPWKISWCRAAWPNYAPLPTTLRISFRFKPLDIWGAFLKPTLAYLNSLNEKVCWLLKRKPF